MNEFTFEHLHYVYEAERKALKRAINSNVSNDFMQGILAVVAELERQMFDREAEKKNE